MRLPESVLERFAGPLVWGETDCAQFVGAMWEHYTGENPARRFRYSTEAEAADLIAQYGSMEALVSAMLGDPVVVDRPDRVKEARLGDVALTSGAGLGPMLGIVSTNCFLVLAVGGFVPLKLDKIQEFWPCRRRP